MNRSEPVTGTLFWLPTILRDGRLNPTETLLLVAIADHVDADDKAWPSIATLAKLARCSYATAQRHLTGLVEKGAIHRVQRYRTDRGRSTYEYYLRREFFGAPLINLEDALYQTDKTHRAPGDKTHRAPGARAEVPNEPPIEEGATPRADCNRGCVDGFRTAINDQGYTVLIACECSTGAGAA